jgi:hypothetical protein
MTNEFLKSRFNPNRYGKQITSEPKKKDIPMLSGELLLSISKNSKKTKHEPIQKSLRSWASIIADIIGLRLNR